MPNILIVEDDKTIAEALVFALEISGFNCKWFTTGGEALHHLENNSIDLILLDIGLPDIDGFDVLRIIRKQSNIPVIILTARGESEDQVLALEGHEADDYVVKKSGSDSPRIIIAKIKALLRRTKPSVKKTNSVFDFNEALQKLSFKGQVLSLTPAECKILTHLVKNPNRVFTRKILLSVIHDKQTGSDESTINTHIKSIRKTLGKIDQENKYITTHRGIGYSLIL
ncbi:MAG: response regulator [Candidatus Thioglobus sp.]|jgi:Response regulators consisting of a CheY-like receiver domain and a winged-helix DNA-binding domain